ncbi:MAG: galactokinase, partial [Actinomycetota bacterium]|nr:galactokinase [Actinomycetota bacterium]
MIVTAVAPGRVNLIGDHTDYTGGLALPMAIDLATTVTGQAGGEQVVLRSVDEADPARLPLDVADPAIVEPPWARYVAGVVAELHPGIGFTGTVSTSIPVGAGLSSSAALELAVALALGSPADPLALALLCQRAEQRASGVPCGIMDQLASAAGVEGHALLLDCHMRSVTPVALPEDVDVVVIHSGETRRLAASGYAERRAQCEAAEQVVGPLRHVWDPTDLDRIADPVVRRRARHVVTENARVLAFVEALDAGDLTSAGQLMAASHASLAGDFEASTPTVDALVKRLTSTHGVHGVRMTGGGFGGCVVALTEPGSLSEGRT